MLSNPRVPKIMIEGGLCRESERPISASPNKSTTLIRITRSLFPLFRGLENVLSPLVTHINHFLSVAYERGRPSRCFPAAGLSAGAEWAVWRWRAGVGRADRAYPSLGYVHLIGITALSWADSPYSLD
jgi:hypothetical protein